MGASAVLQLAQSSARPRLPQQEALHLEHLKPNLLLACLRDGNLMRLSSKVSPAQIFPAGCPIIYERYA